MRCMAELLELRVGAVEAERIRQLELDEMARVNFIEIAKNTIQMCETVIAPKLEEVAAKTLNDICISLEVGKMHDDRLGNKLFKLRSKDRITYADGRSSYSVYGDTYSYEVLEQYLDSHCIKMKSIDDDYWSYGSGLLVGSLIKIYV